MSLRPLFEFDEVGGIHWYPHPMQRKARMSRARFTFMPKGWRGGFTSWVPKLLEDEMRRCGPGHKNLAYFAIAPTLKVATRPGSMVPSLESIFCTYMGYAIYNKNNHEFTITPDGERALWGHAQKEPTKIVVCHAEDPDSFASATFLAGVADEVGQALFRREAWNTLRSRMATTCGQVAPNNPPGMEGMKMGRVFAGSTVYTHNWFVDLYLEWKEYMKRSEAEMLEMCEAERDPAVREEIRQNWTRRAHLGLIHPENNFIRFDSTENPTFSKDEFERFRQIWPDWYFDMRLRAIPRRPAGLIIEDFNDERHYVKPFKIPSSWPRDVAIDFGKRNFYATIWAHDEDRDRHFCYLSYHRSDLDNIEHAQEILAQEPLIQEAVAGQVSEKYDRMELSQGGLIALEAAFKDLWPGLRLTNSAFRLNKCLLFRPEKWDGAPELRRGFRYGAEGLRDELRLYSRPVDPDSGLVLEDEDPQDKDQFHWCDTLRYRATRKFSALMTADFTPRTGPGRAVVEEKAPQPAAEPEGPMICAGGGESGFGAAIADRYGLGFDVRKPYIDIPL